MYLNYIGKRLEFQMHLRHAPENHLDTWTSSRDRSTVRLSGFNPEKLASFRPCAGVLWTDIHGFT
jgi:hypothetical protein